MPKPSALLFGGLVVTCVTLLLASKPTGSPMMDVDMLVPKTFKPFANNGTRVGVSTEWTLTTVTITNHVAETFQKAIPLAQLSEWETLLNINGNVQVMQAVSAIERMSMTLSNTLRLSVAAFAAAGALAVVSLILPHTRAQHQFRRPFPWLGEQTASSNRAKLFRVGVLCERLSALVALIFCALIVLIGGFYCNEIFASVRVLIPGLIKRLSIVCWTHNTDECAILFTPRWGLYSVAAAIAALLLLCLGVLLWPGYNTNPPKHTAIPLYVPYDAYHLLTDYHDRHAVGSPAQEGRLDMHDNGDLHQDGGLHDSDS
ncbi:putative transmembrane protein [Gregarina niphandrodes]|uniref:Transmembrane protein n=1 Tax=Gregarina niphandrodes TaxID=110365 RepID=A0A023B5J5_GRENI|nr:putative transmembrane protein [Gregarina niphandrodes]EZG61011.1 putative transmembrane protein [Gregarina niphandrodes]|eukprot:XP_011130813.1 putative transmembrane protein [Gregarina niphandrodes]